jgi:hypothetical protein
VAYGVWLRDCVLRDQGIEAMPRIGATLGVFATIAFCIGFNIFRYPKVWEVVADMPGQCGSERTPRDSVAIAQATKHLAASKPAFTVPAAVPAPEPPPSARFAGVEKPPIKMVKAAEKYAAIALPSDKKSTAKTKPGGSHAAVAKPKQAAKRPKIVGTAAAPSRDAKPTKKTTPAAGGKPESMVGKDNGPPVSEEAPRPLVPIAPSSFGGDLTGASPPSVAQSPLGGSGTASGTYMIRRLPPIDPMEPRQPLPALPALGPIPFYPTTGVD